MQGTIRKRGDKWAYSFYLGTVDGKKKYKTKCGFKTKSEATKALNIALVDFENGGYVQNKKITMLDFSLDWLEGYVKVNRKISTYNRYKELLNKYILPVIGGMELSSIGIIHIEKILTDTRKLVSSSTTQAVYTLINTILNRALKLRLIKENICKYIERPKREKFIAETLTVEEISKVFNSINLDNEYDYKFYIGMKIIIELGLRRGELSGLEWSNVKFENNSITIRNNLIYSNGYTYMSTTKTLESTRTLYISDDLLNDLKFLKERQDFFKNQYLEYYTINEWENKEYDLVMTWDNGKFIHPMYYLNKLKKLCKAASINKNIRFHDLRHTNATLLLKQGVSLKVIQNRLGHKQLSTTADIYSHVDYDMQIDATNKLLKALECQKNAK